MGILVDLIIVIAILSFVFIGYKKGLTGSLLKLLSFVISIILAFVLYKPVSNLIIEKTQISDTIKSTLAEKVGIENNTENADSDIPKSMMENINADIEHATEEAKARVVDDSTKTVVNLLSALIVFLLVRLILFIVSIFVNQITKLPILKQVDQIGGIAYGLLEGVVIVYIVLGIISLTSVLWNESSIVTAVTKSALGNTLYNNNIILNFFFK